MPIKLGTKGIIGGYDGSIPFIKMYRGSNLVFQVVEEKINPLKALIERNIEKVDIELSNELIKIGADAFMNCKRLINVTIPNSVTSIGASAFQDCTSLKSITIPNSVTFIYGGAFLNCSSLESITIPESVTVIDTSAFEECLSLTNMILLPNNPPALGSTTSISTATTTIYVPSGTKSAYESASIWADLLTRATNPVTFIELS